MVSVPGEFSVAPALPPGLRIGMLDGQVSGTPTAFARPAMYRVFTKTQDSLNSTLIIISIPGMCSVLLPLLRLRYLNFGYLQMPLSSATQTRSRQFLPLPRCLEAFLISSS